MARWIRSLLLLIPLALIAGYANAKPMQRFEAPARFVAMPERVVKKPMPLPMPGPRPLNHKILPLPGPRPRPWPLPMTPTDSTIPRQ
jgi:hypothetical protein